MSQTHMHVAIGEGGGAAPSYSSDSVLSTVHATTHPTHHAFETERIRTSRVVDMHKSSGILNVAENRSEKKCEKEYTLLSPRIFEFKQFCGFALYNQCHRKKLKLETLQMCAPFGN